MSSRTDRLAADEERQLLAEAEYADQLQRERDQTAPIEQLQRQLAAAEARIDELADQLASLAAIVYRLEGK
jgi:pectin methylesterase-like acyl-CoA thioesterase